MVGIESEELGGELWIFLEEGMDERKGKERSMHHGIATF